MGTAWGPSLRDYCPSSSQGPVLSPQVPVLAKADLNPDSLLPFRSPCCPSQYSPLVRPKATDSIKKTLRKIPRVMVLGDRRRRDVTRSANCDSCGDQGLLLPGGNHPSLSSFLLHRVSFCSQAIIKLEGSSTSASSVLYHRPQTSLLLFLLSLFSLPPSFLPLCSKMKGHLYLEMRDSS